MKKFITLVILIGLVILGYLFIKNNPENAYVMQGKSRIEDTISKINNEEIVEYANPASNYCVKNKGKLKMQENSSWTVGICHFSNGSSCEERAFFRGECNSEVQTPIDTPTNENDDEKTICTTEYVPVCAKVQIQCIKAPCEPIEQTFGNKCAMEANKLATFLHDGECKEQK